jgi:LmbE family N-acetylglucosaminyl deacetylase
MLKRILISLVAIVLVLSSFTVSNGNIEKIKHAKAEIINPNANSHVVFYIPHQDDEAINFGVGIMNHIAGGHNVHVVLLTDGSSAVVRTQLGMTEYEFTQARNREFAYSLNILGVKPENVSYRNLKDGSITVSQVETIIREFETKYPKAKHKAYSYTDWHNDHKNSGQALKNLQTAGVVTDARYYIRFGDNPIGITPIKEPFNPIYMNFMLAVSNVYKMENDRLGFYGIGWKSAGHLFEEVEIQPLSRYHK